MDESRLLGLLNPIVGNIFALTFLVFWTKQREKKHILCIALAFGGLANGYVAAHFLLDRLSAFNLTFIGFLYVASTTSILGGLYARAGIKGGIVPLIVTGTLGTALTCYLALTMEFMNSRIFTANATLGVLFAIGALRLYPRSKMNGVEKLLFWVLALISVQFIATPAITTTAFGPITDENYRSSVHWLAVNFLTAFSSVVLALSLIAMCASDLIRQITDLANTDHLTGMFNRRVYEQRAVDTVGKRARTSLPIAMVIADIDNFKAINDEFGHPVGDAVISQIGQLFTERRRVSDTTGRLGGEEFAILLWNTDIRGGRLLAEEMRAAVASMMVDQLGDRQVTISLGVAEILDGEDYNQLYRRADMALFESKRSGRNRVTVSKTTNEDEVMPLDSVA